VSENVVHHVSKCVNQFVAANRKSFLLVFQILRLDFLCATTGADHFVQGHQGINSLEKITISQLLDVIEDKALLVSKCRVQVKVILSLFQFSLELISIFIHNEIVLSLCNWDCCNCLGWL
jgi:hypothetical protein